MPRAKQPAVASKKKIVQLLFAAAQRGNDDEVRRCLRRAQNWGPTLRARALRRSLRIALTNDFAHVVRTLLCAKALVDASHVCATVRWGHAAQLTALVDAKGSVNEVDTSWPTGRMNSKVFGQYYPHDFAIVAKPMTIAAFYLQADCVTCLLALKAAHTHEHQSALMLAICNARMSASATAHAKEDPAGVASGVAGGGDGASLASAPPSPSPLPLLPRDEGDDAARHIVCALLAAKANPTSHDHIRLAVRLDSGRHPQYHRCDAVSLALHVGRDDIADVLMADGAVLHWNALLVCASSGNSGLLHRMRAKLLEADDSPCCRHDALLSACFLNDARCTTKLLVEAKACFQPDRVCQGRRDYRCVAGRLREASALEWIGAVECLLACKADYDCTHGCNHGYQVVNLLAAHPAPI